MHDTALGFYKYIYVYRCDLHTLLSREFAKSVIVSLAHRLLEVSLVLATQWGHTMFQALTQCRLLPLRLLLPLPEWGLRAAAIHSDAFLLPHFWFFMSVRLFTALPGRSIELQSKSLVEHPVAKNQVHLFKLAVSFISGGALILLYERPFDRNSTNIHKPPSSGCTETE